MKTNSRRCPTADQLANLPRPAAFLEVKHTILRANDETDLRQARKMIDNYIFKVCEQNLREERKKDLIYILGHRIGELLSDGTKLPSFEGEIQPAQ